MVRRTPSYGLHRPGGQAVGTRNGRNIYFGRRGSPRSRAEFDQLVGEEQAAGWRPAF